MKKLLFISALAIFTSCSTCYECDTDVQLTDANTGDTLGSTVNTEEFCTADKAEVEERETEGARCTES